MTIIKPIQNTLLLSFLTLALVAGCDKAEDKKTDDKKVDDKKVDDKKVDDKKAAEPEPEPPKGPMFNATNIVGQAVSVPIAPFDLTPAELPGLTIQAPEGTTIEPSSPSGFHIYNSSVNYSLSITAGPFSKDEAKKLYGILDPDGKIVDESETHVTYERSNKGGFLFQAGVTVGDKQYHCGSVATGIAFDRDVIDQTVASCKSITAAAGAAAPAATPDGAAPAPTPAPAPQ
jgi:hypothetical protein